MTPQNGESPSPYPELIADWCHTLSLTPERMTMPTLQTLERFIARVEENVHDEAIAEFYTENATMRENMLPPRVGRDYLIENERKVLARAKSVRSRCVHPVLVNGDIVVIRWIFDFEWLNGTTTHMEELTYQRWEGERIAEEQFFYDPAQLVPKQPEEVKNKATT
jgi:hypothetical protein